MISRLWRCTATPDNTSRYLDHFQHAVLPELRQLEGFRSGYVFRRNAGDAVEITVMTLWNSMEAIRRFAGDNVDTAVVAPEAQAILLSFDTTVTHSEVAVDTERPDSQG
jgi:heme-degrading monooxygenase HmoA